MNDFWLILFGNLAIVLVLIAVHELGHYLAGLSAGIPVDVMRIRLLAFPQHVAIRDGDRWLSPTRDIVRYIEVTRRFLTNRAAAFRWVAGGVVLEAAFATAVCLAAKSQGFQNVAFWTALMSLAMYLINAAVMDLPWAILYRHPAGDTSGLWSIAKLPALVLTLLMIGLRAALVWWSAA